MGMQHFLDSWNTNEVGNNIKNPDIGKPVEWTLCVRRVGKYIFTMWKLRSLSFDIFRKLLFIEAHPAWCGHWNRTFLWPCKGHPFGLRQIWLQQKSMKKLFVMTSARLINFSTEQICQFAFIFHAHSIISCSINYLPPIKERDNCQKIDWFIVLIVRHCFALTQISFFHYRLARTRGSIDESVMNGGCFAQGLHQLFLQSTP